MITCLGINSDSDTLHLFCFPSLSDIEGIIFVGKKFLEKRLRFIATVPKLTRPPACGRQRMRNKGEQKLFVSKEGAVGNIYAKLVNMNMTHSAFKTVRDLLIALPL